MSRYTVHRTNEKRRINEDGRGLAEAYVYEVRIDGCLAGHLIKRWHAGQVFARNCVGGSIPGYAMWDLDLINEDDHRFKWCSLDFDSLADAMSLLADLTECQKRMEKWHKEKVARSAVHFSSDEAADEYLHDMGGSEDVSD